MSRVCRLWLLAAVALLGIAQEPAALPRASQRILVPFWFEPRGAATSLGERDVELLVDGAPASMSRLTAGSFSARVPALLGGAAAREATPVHLILLLNTTGGSALEGVQPLPTTTPPVPPLRSIRPDPRVEFAKWLQADLLDEAPNVEVSVYGFDQTLRRFCAPTRAPDLLRRAIASADRAVKGQGELVPLENSGNPIAWEEAIFGAIHDAARSTSDSLRIVLASVRGLPVAGPSATAAATCKNDGAIVFLSFRDRGWTDYALSQVQSASGSGVVPRIPGVKWERLTPMQRLQWIRQEDAAFQAFERFAAETGGRSGDPFRSGAQSLSGLITAIRWRATSVYAGEFVPPLSVHEPGAHLLEIRLRDPGMGSIAGGSRRVIY